MKFLRKIKFLIFILISIFLYSCNDNQEVDVIDPIVWTVNFETNGGSKIEKVKVNNDSLISIPNEPVKNGYIFISWYFDEKLSNEVDFDSYKVTSDITLYAKWEEVPKEDNYFTIIFETNGGSHIESQSIKEGSIINNVELPIKEGYEFDGWYLDEEFETKLVIDEYLVNSNITLYAKWVKEEKELINVIEYSGHLESAFIKWNKNLNVNDYNVYYSKEEINNYIKIDKMLIREYPDYYRADILGLKPGKYKIKVVSVVNEVEDETSKEVTVDVLSHDRSGFAFSSESHYKSASGAYNDDGTLKENAQVIYVTKNNAKTVTAYVNSKIQTGLQSILDAKQKANTSNDILCIRLIGKISKDDLDYISSSAQGLQIKGKSAYTNMNITIEGVGDDATVYGFGFLVRNSSNVEFRNFAIMGFMDDGISLDTNNSNIWIHNMDLYYGNVGSDADQAKGDGSIDIKGTSTYITVSYVHFVDSGKASLCGMNENAEFMVTYHHNWFDHSDSRHPRIRVGSVHIYNNLFDGNSKYGVGVTMGASAFVEANYFKNCKYPMMSSKQGTDALGDGTFSGEAGGIIKAYNNKVIGEDSLIYSNANSTSFDAYLANTRNELVPNNYKTLSGNYIYNNFDSIYDLGVLESNIDNPNDVEKIVKQYAGRINGGDFIWNFTDQDNTDYDVNSELKSAINSYQSKLVKVLGENVIIDDKDEPSIKDNPVISNSINHSFTENGINSDIFAIVGNLSTSKGTVNYNDLVLTKCLKIESSTSIKFTLTEKMTLTLVFGGTTNASGKKIKINGTKYEISDNILELELEAGSYEITKGDTLNLFYISLEN